MHVLAGEIRGSTNGGPSGSGPASLEMAYGFVLYSTKTENLRIIKNIYQLSQPQCLQCWLQRVEHTKQKSEQRYEFHSIPTAILNSINMRRCVSELEKTNIL
jgi:hypothetical protein